MDPAHIVRELRRRGVFRGAALYIAAAWAALQVTDLALPGLDLPESAIRYVWVGVFLGFPLAVLFSWRYEITLDGIVRTPPSAGEAVDTSLHAFDYALLAALLAIAAAVAYGVVGQVQRAHAPARAALTPPAEGRLSMVVLPFKNVSGDPEQEYFSDGLTDELIVQLGRLHPSRLGVIARTSAMRYKNTDKPIAEIGDELHVGYVLEGSARREGDRVRINVDLIQASDQTQVWAESYDRETAGILELQRDVAQSVARSLSLRLLPEEQARLSRIGRVNPDAYDAYLKGSQYWIRLGRADLDAAERYFDLALSKDPKSAPAYAGLAMVWSCRKQMGFTDPAIAGAQMRQAAEQAIALDDTLPEAHVALASLLTWTDWEWAAAEREWRRAIELNPNYPDTRVFYSHYLIMMNRQAEGLRQVEQALEVDPFNLIFQGFHAVVLLDLGRTDEAIAVAEEVLRVMPDNPLAISTVHLGYALKQDYARSLAAAKVGWRTSYGVLDADGELERTLAAQGFEAAMGRAAELLVARARETFVLPSDIAFAYQLAGDNDRAIEWLARGIEVRDPNVPYLNWSLYDPLRSDPRFHDLVRRLQLPE